MRQRIIRCTLSGSFRRDREGLSAAYYELVGSGCQVLSPHRLDFDESDTLFVRDVAETEISEETLERHHLLAISQSDFVWLHAPNGYIGTSTALEIGFAAAKGIPVFCKDIPDEHVFSAFIGPAPSVFSALELLA